jgi:PAS domain S-box-containing protein
MDSQSRQFITGDPAFAVDHSGAIVLWNEAAEQSFGISCSDALGRKCWNLMSGEDSYGNRYCCEHCPIREMGFRHEPVHHFKSTFKTADHKSKQFDVSCLTIYDDSDNELLMHICHPESSLQIPKTTHPSAGAHLGELSQREVEILRLLADKVKTRDIADTLSISVRTVRTHIQHLMYKLHVHKRKEAIATGKRLNLI